MDEIRTLIEKAKSIIITTHKSPDGDAIGSSLALYHFLIQFNKKVTIVVPDSFPSFLDWMPLRENILHYDSDNEKAEEAIKNGDLIFGLDYNSLNRIGGMKEAIKSSDSVKIIIDHHQDPDRDFADHYIVDVSSCSTAQLIYEFIEELEAKDKLNKSIAECLYCGIMTDTGSFRFPSTTSKTHQIIAHLIDLGANGSDIHNLVYDNYSEQRLRLLGYALTERMKIFEGLNTALIYLSQKDLKTFHFKKGDTEGLVNYPLSIKGIKFSVLIVEKEGEVSLSLRSKGGFYVNDFAKEHFNGGGHIYAAGGVSYKSLEETVAYFETAIIQYKRELVS